MPLRIEDERVPSRPTDDDPDRARRRAPRGWIVLVVGAAVLLLVVLIGGLRGTLGGSAPAPPASGGTPGVPSAGPGEQSPVVRGREVAPGLVLGTASVEALNQDFLYGVRVGFPRTVDGAVAAAINYDAAWHTPAMFTKQQRDVLNRRIYTKVGLAEVAMDDELAAAFDKQLRINDKGQVLTKAGTVDRSRRLIAASYPRYGAYKIDSVQPSRERPGEVRVTVWRPFVLGTGTDTDLSNVGLGWIQTTVTVAWDRGDWRVNDSATEANTPKPPNTEAPNASFADRAVALGPGWSVPADTTEQLLPGTVVP